MGCQILVVRDHMLFPAPMEIYVYALSRHYLDACALLQPSTR